MRIDFFHIDLLNKSIEIKKVSTVDTDCDASSDFNRSPESKRTQGNNIEYTKDYLDIQRNLRLNKNSEKGSRDNNNDFLPEEDLSNLRDAIINNDYSINIKALSTSLLKYIERN